MRRDVEVFKCTRDVRLSRVRKRLSGCDCQRPILSAYALWSALHGIGRHPGSSRGNPYSGLSSVVLGCVDVNGIRILRSRYQPGGDCTAGLWWNCLHAWEYAHHRKDKSRWLDQGSISVGVVGGIRSCERRECHQQQYNCSGACARSSLAVLQHPPCDGAHSGDVLPHSARCE